MSQIVVIGCGVVGAAIAYELSRVPGLKVTVLDRQAPGQGATGAALGVLMGAISGKVKGKNWQLRQASMQRYETLIPELEAIAGCTIPFNRQGILMLCTDGEDMTSWKKLAEIRRSQGFSLEIWDIGEIQLRSPHLNCENITAAIYSPHDRQVDPRSLTLALVEAAQHNGVTFDFGVTVQSFQGATTEVPVSCQQIQTTGGILDVDWVVVAAGLGSCQLTQALAQPVDIRPVLGQALHLRLARTLGRLDFQPVFTGDDVHIVPVGKGEYWVGATVEFPTDGTLVPSSDRLEAVLQKAIAFCPALADATVVRTWSGLRPRPEGQPAPVIAPLGGYSNVLLATGHYRNGILLAPATALAIREMITASSGLH